MDEAWGQLFSQEVKTYVARELAKLRDELHREFESRISAIEGTVPSVRGIFRQGEAYSTG